MADTLETVKAAVAQGAGSAPSSKFRLDSVVSQPAQYFGGTPTGAYGGTPQVNYNMGTIDDLKREVYNYAATKDPQFAAISRTLYQSGFITKRQLGNPLYAADGIERAANVYQGYAATAGSGAVAFKDWLAWYAQNSKPQPGAAGAYTGPVTTTAYTVTDRTTASELLNKAAEDMIGRRLTDKELNKYVSQFNDAEKSNPQVSTSSGSGASRSSVTKTATDKQVLLEQIIAKNPDFADYQIDHQVMDLFVNRINRGKQVLNG